MSRRIFLGQDGTGALRIRAAKPAYDALTAPLDGILFDADAVPGRIITQGKQFCANNPYQVTYPNTPQATTIAHGIDSSLSYIITAIGQAQNSDGTLADDWRYWGHGINGGGAGSVVSRPLGNAQMLKQFCTPFRFSGSFGPDSNGNDRDYWGGWWISWDSTNLTVTNNCGNGVYVRWMALEL